MAEPFVYDKLSQNQFRLATLSRNQRGHVIVSLNTVPLVPAPRYRALSYSWGDSDPDAMLGYPSVTCTSAATCASGAVRISQNLLAAIQSISDDDRDALPIWVDSFCINQGDQHGEKPQQIALMHQIFGNAQEVIAWLGPESASGGSNVVIELCILFGSNAVDHLEAITPQLPHLQDRLLSVLPFNPYPLTSKHLSELMRLLHAATDTTAGVAMNEAYFEHLGIPHYRDRIWEHLIDLFCRDILIRVWCFGEILLCGNTVARCGRLSVPWRIYKEMGMALSHTQLLFHNIYAYGIKKKGAEKKINLLRPFMYTGTEYFWLHVRNGRYKQCSKLSGRMRGHISLADERVRNEIRAHPSFRYESQYLALYKHTAKAIMKEWGVHQTLTAVGSLLKFPLPSWCPDYSKPPSDPASTPFGRAGLFKRNGQQIFEADEKVDDIIHVGGFQVDTIEETLTCDWAWERVNTDDNVGPQGHAAINVAWLRRARDLIARTKPPSVMEAYWQTILAFLPPDADGKPMIAHNFPSNGARGLELLGTRFAELARDVSQAQSVLQPEQFDEMQLAMDYLGKVWSTNMAIFRTTKGRTGFASRRVCKGDRVCIFVGNSHLYLLRQAKTARLDNFVSVAYIRGLMMGEGLQGLREGSHEMFAIC